MSRIKRLRTPDPTPPEWRRITRDAHRMRAQALAATLAAGIRLVRCLVARAAETVPPRAPGRSAPAPQWRDEAAGDAP